jgi:hypothetical protein
MGKYKVELYSPDNIKQLLQETYRLADEQLIQAQNEMDKLANSTKLEEEVMDAKQKYSKAMNDYMGVKDKAISKKMEIAKLLSELLNSYKNNSQGITDASGGVKQTFDLTKIKEMVKNMHDDKEKTKTIELTKK